jgi:hypothetical protein
VVELDCGTPRVFASEHGFWACWTFSHIAPKLYLWKDGLWHFKFKDHFRTREEIDKLLSEDHQYFYKD